MDDKKIISGKNLAKELRADLKDKVAEFEKKFSKKPGLSVVLVGDNEASHIYVNMKEKACHKIGLNSFKHVLPKDSTQEKVEELIMQLNEDSSVHGILVQLPLPKHLNEPKILNLISTEKDVDGFHPINVGLLHIGEKALVPCTPAGVIKLIESTGIEIEGKTAVVLGRSNIVGKPVAALLTKRNATVTVCHSRTKNLKDVVKGAEILVAAIGKPQFVKGDWVGKGAVVIDVGTNRLPDGKIVGDVDFDKAIENAAFITPVPGGVGPMTITMLLVNTYEAAINLEGDKR